METTNDPSEVRGPKCEIGSSAFVIPNSPFEISYSMTLSATARWMSQMEMQSPKTKVVSRTIFDGPLSVVPA